MTKYVKKILTSGFFILFTFLSVQSFSQPNGMSDTLITTEVKAKILAEPSLSMFKMGVSTHRGIVTFSGVVDSDAQATTLIDIAESITGVKDVDVSQLVVKASKTPLTDILITSKVKAMFLSEKIFTNADVAAVNVHVETNNGVVFLTGTVDTQAEADNAVRITKTINGVKKVESHLQVKSY